MTDPLTISTGVAGLLALAIDISTILKRYISDVKDAKTEAGILLTEVSILNEVLERLVGLLRSEDVQEISFDETAILGSVITLCQTKVQDLYKKIGDLPTKEKISIKRVIWPFKKNECQQIAKELRRFTKTLEFSLVISNWFVLF